MHFICVRQVSVDQSDMKLAESGSIYPTHLPASAHLSLPADVTRSFGGYEIVPGDAGFPKGTCHLFLRS
jgi:hypothetical protein